MSHWVEYSKETPKEVGDYQITYEIWVYGSKVSEGTTKERFDGLTFGTTPGEDGGNEYRKIVHWLEEDRL